MREGRIRPIRRSAFHRRARKATVNASPTEQHRDLGRARRVPRAAGDLPDAHHGSERRHTHDSRAPQALRCLQRGQPPHCRAVATPGGAAVRGARTATPRSSARIAALDWGPPRHRGDESLLESLRCALTCATMPVLPAAKVDAIPDDSQGALSQDGRESS